MRRLRWVMILFPVLAVSLLLSQLSSAGTTFRVNEANTRVLLDDNRAMVSLAIENPTGRLFPAHILIEVLDPEGKVVTTSARDENLRKGASAVVLPLTFQLSALSHSDLNEMLWYRLRYRVTALSDSTEKTEGILSLSEITPDIFRVSVVSSESAREGTRYRAQVRTVHPISSRAVKGVRLKATMEMDNATLRAEGVTDAEGYAALDFELPKKIEDDGRLELKVVARRGPLEETAEDEIEVDRRAQMFVSTDKPIYQPGQVLHIRALMFDATRHAVVDKEATLDIEDPENKTVFSADLKTSRFGVASADWPIPDDIRLGDYNIKVTLDGGDNDDSEAYTYVKISRYDLPNFAVQAKPDRPFYLPGQPAAVEVHADYLFGQPVKRGHVRVVREMERRWSYQEQKWETEEGEKYEGEADERGLFTAHINLAEETDKLLKEDYSRYHDLTYAAYVTDPTTNRTEQRRFDLRLTKSAIHVYITEAGSAQAKDFPLQFYLSTYYADGTPAQCEVAIGENLTTQSADGSSLSSHEQPLGAIRTNRYGVARVSGLSLPAQPAETDEAALTFLAHDAKGATGRQTNTFSYSDHAVLRVETDKPLYRAGEPLRVQLVSSEPEMKAVVDVWQGPAVIQSKVVRLHDGRASLVVPYQKAFRDSVIITAYAYSGALAESRYDIPSAARRVLYPHERDLKLDVRLNQQEYKPGEDARALFEVRDAEGRSIESALGIVIFDRAVEERARTDNEFGSRYSFSYAYDTLNGYEGELSGFTMKDFYKMDLKRPVPEDVKLVAEMLLGSGDYTPHIFSSREYSLDQREIFSKLVARQVKPLEDALAARYDRVMEYPSDEPTLRRMLMDAGLDFNQQRDPWGTPLRASFHIERELDVLKLESAGADKRFDTDDDFVAAHATWPYFRPLGEKLNDVVWQYHKRTGGYVHDARVLQSELSAGGVDWGAQRDRWGKPLHLEFGLSGTNYTVEVKSGGPNGRFETGKEASSDDFIIWTAFADYFFERREEISTALADHLRLTGLFPQTEKELRATLEKSQIDLDESLDPWGHNYYVAISKDPRFGSPFTIQTYSTYDEATKRGREISPDTQPNNLVEIRSAGADGKRGTADDFDVAALTRSQIVQLGKGQHAPRINATVRLGGASGAISGTITDPMGAVVAGARVTATNLSSSAIYETITDDNGRFTLSNLPAGTYVVRFESPGFSVYTVNNVPVRSSNITRLDGTLNVAGASETVEVTSTADLAVVSQTQVSMAAARTNDFQLLEVAGRGRQQQISTPRLREYFPETLVWQPSLETDARGRARLDFKLADNITTWKMAVIGTTIDGEVGVVEKEIRAFQPFFAELDPPRILTEGDEIQLPVVLRNYLDKPQAVDLELKPETWFALTGPARQRAEVPAGESSRETFNLRAVSSVTDGKQRVTATGPEASDAIEKPVTVHPDGEERAVTASGILGDSTTLEMNIPAELIKSSLRSELKIYPNLLAHVAESVDGILERPHGCGEQTISSTYPNLMILRFNKSAGQDSPVTAKARQYLQEGYKRLLNYRAETGGFSYWGGREAANLALSAYALSFLNDAREFLEIDESVMNGARDYLIRQQRPDGGWDSSSSSNSLAPRADGVLTSYIARILSRVEAGSKGNATATAAPGEQKSAAAVALKHALDYLARHADEANDAYMFAAYASAATAAGDTEGATRAIKKLRSLAQTDEAGTVSWSSETGTPFHGWGMTGRLETTALALQALTEYCGTRNAECGLSETDSSNPPSAIRTSQLIDRGLLYLLRLKDRYGVWLSTQATVNVLNALTGIFSRQNGEASGAATPGADDGGQAEIIINGRPATTVSLPQGRFNNPVRVDISQFVAPGDNRITIRRGARARPASAQAVSTFYVPWSASSAARNKDAAGGNNIRLTVNFNKAQASINEEITCRVEAAGRNYGGMMLAEVGLPPGADVDRATLEEAVKNSNWGLSRYDVLPDRVVIYLWPRSDGTRFEFKFRPRFGLSAQSAPSSLYDYYNPEARVTVAPVKFVVR